MGTSTFFRNEVTNDLLIEVMPFEAESRHGGDGTPFFLFGRSWPLGLSSKIATELRICCKSLFLASLAV